jgi:hypothetical protein
MGYLSELTRTCTKAQKNIMAMPFNQQKKISTFKRDSDSPILVSFTFILLEWILVMLLTNADSALNIYTQNLRRKMDMANQFK